MRDLRLALLLAITPTMAYVLHDLVFQLPDNEGEASLGFFITVVGLLSVWAATGYAAARPVDGKGPGVVSGAIAGMVSVAMLGLTSFVLNELFVDRMSYEPDRIRAFQQSGYATMREYLRHQGWGPGPLLLVAAAIAGAIGAAGRTFTRRAVARE